MTRVELVLVNGTVRALDLPAGTSSIANALARLDEWIETVDGGWVQKSHVVEVRDAEDAETAGTTVEYEALNAAAGAIVVGSGHDEDSSGSRFRRRGTDPRRGVERGA